MKKYLVYVPVVRWQEWAVETESEEDACVRVLDRGEGECVEDSATSDVGEGTYAEEVVE